MASCQFPEEYQFPALPAAGTFCRPDPVPRTLHVEGPYAPDAPDSVPYHWDEARQAWVGPDGRELPPEIARLITAASH